MHPTTHLPKSLVASEPVIEMDALLPKITQSLYWEEECPLNEYTLHHPSYPILLLTSRVSPKQMAFSVSTLCTAHPYSRRGIPSNVYMCHPIYIPRLSGDKMQSKGNVSGHAVLHCSVMTTHYSTSWQKLQGEIHVTGCP